MFTFVVAETLDQPMSSWPLMKIAPCSKLNKTIAATRSRLMAGRACSSGFLKRSGGAMNMICTKVPRFWVGTRGFALPCKTVTRSLSRQRCLVESCSQLHAARLTTDRTSNCNALGQALHFTCRLYLIPAAAPLDFWSWWKVDLLACDVDYSSNIIDRPILTPKGNRKCSLDTAVTSHSGHSGTDPMSYLQPLIRCMQATGGVHVSIPLPEAAVSEVWNLYWGRNSRVRERSEDIESSHASYRKADKSLTKSIVSHRREKRDGRMEGRKVAFSCAVSWEMALQAWTVDVSKGKGLSAAQHIRFWNNTFLRTLWMRKRRAEQCFADIPYSEKCLRMLIVSALHQGKNHECTISAQKCNPHS